MWAVDSEPFKCFLTLKWDFQIFIPTRVGQNRINAPYMTVYTYICTYARMALTNPSPN
jgi:hypothetical protein